MTSNIFPDVVIQGIQFGWI